ncbi:unnamed protein product [Closterium sp. NIES-65]|nr:unnamed protein product [Closterium sp. NIES-65]
MDTVKVLLSTADSTAPRCLDGSPAGYYHQRGTGTGSKRWLITLEGGGWCFNMQRCVRRKATGLGSSATWPNPVPGQPGKAASPGGSASALMGGIGSANATVNPLFYNWNVVLVKYCDGASFAGSAGAVKRGGAAMYAMGAGILKAIIQDLLQQRGMAGAQQVVLSGCSAGAVAVAMKCDSVAAMLPAPLQPSFKCIMDAGFFLDGPAVNGEYYFRGTIQTLFSLHHMDAGVHPACAKYYAARNETWKCFFPQYGLHFVRTPLFLVQSILDYSGIAKTLAPEAIPEGAPIRACMRRGNVAACPKSTADVLARYSRGMEQTVRDVVKERNAAGSKMKAFLFSAVAHCTMGDDAWAVNKPMMSSRVNLAQMLRQWIVS